MLNEIFQTLKAHQGEPLPDKVPSGVPNKLRGKHPEFSDAVWEVYALVKRKPTITLKELGYALGISDRMVRKHISTLRDAGLLVRVGSNKTGYWEVRSE